jgi:hypothetical protein
MFCGATPTWRPASSRTDNGAWLSVLRSGTPICATFGTTTRAFCVCFDMYIHIFVSERKTHVYGGQWVDVARPLDGSFGVFDALLLGKRVFGRGFVMPHIDVSGRVGLDRPMEYDSYVVHLRHALVTVSACLTTRRSSLRRTPFALVLPPRRSTLALTLS